MLMLRGGALVIMMVGALAACGDGPPPPLGDPIVVPPDDGGLVDEGGNCIAEGCPCTTEGQVIECGKIYRRVGSYVSCSIGHTTCTMGKWGKCTGDAIFGADGG